MFGYDKACIKRFSTPYSPHLQRLRAKKNILRMHLHSLLCGKPMAQQIHRLQQVLIMPIKLPLGVSATKNLLWEVNTELKTSISTASKAWKEHLVTLSELYAEENLSTEAKRLKQIIKAEETKQLFRKLKYLRSKSSKSGLTRIMIPTNPDDDPKMCTSWKTINDPQEMESLLLARNQSHFGQAKGTPFAVDPLKSDVDFATESVSSSLILQGNYSTSKLDDIIALLISKLKSIEYLQCSTLQLTSADFTNKLKAWKESTSTSPSGRHLGHYMALVKPHGISPSNNTLFAQMESQRAEILSVHLGIINYCLKFGYSLKRWQTVVNVMIEKEPGNPQIHRLRVIHIYETDYNLMLSVKHRDLVHSMNDNLVFNDGIYSNRPGFNAIDPVFIEELQNKFNRLTRHSQIKMDVDADSCYNRIIPSLAMLVLQKYGMPRNVCIVQGKTLQDIQYNLKTGMGISE